MFMCTDLFPVLVHRLRVSNYDTSRTAAKAARSPTGDSADFKGEGVQQSETVEDSLLTEEDEVFEWREVFRGITLLSPSRLPQLIRAPGLTDIQTWLTGLAYASLIVSLYSYSLFLYAPSNSLSHSTHVYPRPTIVSGLGFSGGQAQLHTGTHFFC
jgi:MFS transporter, ACS family, DAL5 transporter family protein